MLRYVYARSQSDLAPNSLPSLSLNEIHPHLISILQRPDTSRLTGLTRLELTGQNFADNMAPIVTNLRKLRLRELVLLNCTQIEQKQLFVPGALTTLTALHIEDSSCSSYTAESLQPVPAGEQKMLREVGAAVFKLPQLSQISGWCDLFAIGMQQGLRAWDKRALPEGTMVSYKTDHRCTLDWMKLWTKPEIPRGCNFTSSYVKP